MNYFDCVRVRARRLIFRNVQSKLECRFVFHLCQREGERERVCGILILRMTEQFFAIQYVLINTHSYHTYVSAENKS